MDLLVKEQKGWNGSNVGELAEVPPPKLKVFGVPPYPKRVL